jgi:glycosyltransferase involved in cell wall biosynthesis
MEINKPKQSVTLTRRSDSRLHLLEVIGNSAIGGMENYLINFISHLPADQFKVTCICPYESPFTAGLRKAGVDEVFITPIADDPAWRSIQLTVEISRLKKIDLLHAHMPKAHVLAGLAGCILHKPVVASVHGMNVTSHELGITRGVGSHLLTNCQESYTQALAMGVPPEKVNLVRNGVDTAALIFDPKNNELRNYINLDKSIPLIGFVGRLEHEKGPDLFIRAADYVHQHRPEVHFAIAGEGSMRGELEEMCVRMRLNQHVHFVNWWTKPVSLYSGLDILAHTSRSDGTSLVLLEAMSCTRPTVAIAVGGVREIIENESTGMLAGAGDWEDVGIKIIQLLDEPHRMKMIGAAGRTRIEEHFNVVKNTCRTAEVLRRIANCGLNGNKITNHKVLNIGNS